MMATTLQEYEAQIEALEQGQIDEPMLTPEGRRQYRTTAQETCARLYSIWGELRRTLWSRPYQGWARGLQDRCRREIDRLAAEHHLMYEGGPPPRWPAYVDGGGNLHPAID